MFEFFLVSPNLSKYLEFWITQKEISKFHCIIFDIIYNTLCLVHIIRFPSDFAQKSVMEPPLLVL